MAPICRWIAWDPPLSFCGPAQWWMLFFAASISLRAGAIQWRRRRSPVQLVFEFVEVDDPKVALASVWQTLDPQQRADLLMILARLMARAIEPKEVNDD